MVLGVWLIFIMKHILGKKHIFPCSFGNKRMCLRINLCIWCVEFVRAKFHDSFCTNMFYFNWPNFLSTGIVDVAFQSAETGKYATPTGHLKFHFVPLAVSYEHSRIFQQSVPERAVDYNYSPHRLCWSY